MYNNLFLKLIFVSLIPGACKPSADKPQHRQPSNSPAGDRDKVSNSSSDGQSASTTGVSSDLATMSLEDLLVIEQERINQNNAEEEELHLLDAINSELCVQLEKKRRSCPAIKRLIPEVSEQGISCDGQVSEIETQDAKIEVSIPENKHGQFKIIANDLYESSQFGAGKTIISFSRIAGGELQAPQFLKVFKLVIVSADKEVKLPTQEGFVIGLAIEGEELISEPVKDSDDAKKTAERSEYRIPLGDLISLRKSAKCLVDQNQIDLLKKSIRNSIVGRQVANRKIEYKRLQAESETKLGAESKSREELTISIAKLRKKIELRLPILNSERDRQFNLAAEMKTNINIGCQAGQPIEALAIELKGRMSTKKLPGVRDHKLIAEVQAGSATELAIDLGGVKFTVDFKKENIFGSSYSYNGELKNGIVVSRLDRVLIRKKGIGYDNVKVACNQNSGIIAKIDRAIHTATCYESREEGVFTIDEINILVNDRLIFKKQTNGILLDHDQRIWEGVIEDNEMWVRLMQDESCNVTD